jgi:prolipoprotein diacylglyceryltransferase
VGKETNSSLGIKFIRDYYSPNQVVNDTKINNVNEAYNAVATNPNFAMLLEKVPAKHPAQLYEAFLYIFVFLLLFLLYWKTKTAEKQGLLFGYFLIMLWSVRFAVEYVKESQGGIEKDFGLLTTGQWLSIPFILIGIYCLFIAEKPIEEDLL